MKKYVIIWSLLIATTLSACKFDSKENKESKKQFNMTIKKEIFGEIDGKQVFLYTLKNINGITVKITNYGGIVTSIIVPDNTGKFGDVVLGFNNLNDYLDGHPYFGAIVGRYANRISKGKFTLNGKEYSLAINNGTNHLHGGIKGFDKVIWNTEKIQNKGETGLRMSYFSKDGEEGFPGNLGVIVKYILTNKNELKIKYQATTDKPTPVNLTHHSYFNLAGKEDILDHKLTINADKYTEINKDFIPTGKLRSVKNTPFDFTSEKTIGEEISDVKGGYDHNFVLNNFTGRVRKICKVHEPVNGRVMEVFSNQPGLQFYTGNFLDGTEIGKNAQVYKRHYGFCLETQYFPDSPNHPEFPSTILKAGETYRQTTIYKFSVN